MFLGVTVFSAPAIRATETIDAPCRERLTIQVTTLKAAFTANRELFDKDLDRFLTRYAAAHPQASKEDYKAVLDQVYEERFSARFEIHRNLLRGYEAVLDGTGELRGVCTVPAEEMSAATRKTIAKNKQLYDEILREMSKMLPE